MNKAIAREHSISKIHVQKYMLHLEVKYKFTSTFFLPHDTAVSIYRL